MDARRVTVIYEQTGYWAALWRLEWARLADRDERLTSSDTKGAHRPTADFDCQIIETRLPETCQAAVAAAPSAFVLVELSSRECDASLDLVRSLADRFPRARVVVVTNDPNLAHYRWIARELGAVHFLGSGLALAEAAALADRHWQSLPVEPMGAAETIWATLPWG